MPKKKHQQKKSLGKSKLRTETAHPPVVGIRIPDWAPFTRGIFEGIVEYIRINRITWQIRFSAATTNEIAPVKIDSDWSGDGLIVFRPSHHEVEAWRERGIPVVNLSSESIVPGLESLIPDNESVGRLAARHLLDLGMAHFAFWGDPTRRYSRERWAGFAAEMKAHGHEAKQMGFEISKLPQRRKWTKVREEMLAQLEGLPKPVGIFARDDIAAAALSRACSRLKLTVPGDVALLGFGNDLILCHTATPPLSSITYPGKRIGYGAAEALSRLLIGRSSDGVVSTVPPGSLVARESTEILAFGDKIIVEAVKMIRREAPKQPLRVSELIERLPISRAGSQKRFHAAVGRRPKDEITRVRLQRLCQLLEDTDWSIKEIAFDMQFESSEELGRFIRRSLGTNSTEYRRHHRK